MAQAVTFGDNGTFSTAPYIKINRRDIVQNPNMIAKRIHYKIRIPPLDNGCYFATYFDLGTGLVQRVPVKVFIVNQ